MGETYLLTLEGNMQNFRVAVHGGYAFFFLFLMHLAPGLAVVANLLWGESIRSGQLNAYTCAGIVLGIIIVVLLIVQYWWLVLILLVGAAFALFQESRGYAILLFFVGIAAIYNGNKYVRNIPDLVKHETRQITWDAIKVPWFLSLAITTTGIFAGLPGVWAILIEVVSLLWSLYMLGRSLYQILGPGR